MPSLTQLELKEERAQHENPSDSLDGLPIEDLTRLVRALPQDRTSPFDADDGYEAFFNSLCRALHRNAPRHVILVRERGVGERAVLLEMARRGTQGKPRFFAGKSLTLIDCKRLPTDQLRRVMSALPFADGVAAVDDDGVLCLDGFGVLLRGMNQWEIRPGLLAAFSQARCRVIGIATPREYEEHFSGDAELQDLFSAVFLPEPSSAAAIALVRHFATGLEQEYDVRIEDDAVSRSVALTDAHVLHERLPYKAVKVLRSACDDLDYDRSQNGSERDVITEADVVARVAQVTGIPVATLSGVGEGFDYKGRLGELIVGQSHAVAEVATELGLIKAGMTEPGKPASVMMFIGQTGTGKTEMAKALARFYSSSKRLKTFTLGNFSEPHSVSGIIGVPPGYVGHDQGGRLINELNADPYGVFLLDEADKAHPDVLQPFLNLFDEGWIADQKGNRAYANRAIFILTTNVGQRQVAEMCRSGKTDEEIRSAMKESLSRIRHTKSNRPVFSAEFLARVKRIIVFRSLDRSAMEGICDRVTNELEHEWRTKRQKTMSVPHSLRLAIARRAHDVNDSSQGREGGRIVRKLIADILEAPLQRAISEAPEVYRRCREIVIEHSTEEIVSPDAEAPRPPIEIVRATFL